MSEYQTIGGAPLAFGLNGPQKCRAAIEGRPASQSTESPAICCADSAADCAGARHPDDCRLADFHLADSADRAASHPVGAAAGRVDADRPDADPDSAAAGSADWGCSDVVRYSSHDSLQADYPRSRKCCRWVARAPCPIQKAYVEKLPVGKFVDRWQERTPRRGAGIVLRSSNECADASAIRVRNLAAEKNVQDASALVGDADIVRLCN